jgi:hypothetical protein
MGVLFVGALEIARWRTGMFVKTTSMDSLLRALRSVEMGSRSTYNVTTVTKEMVTVVRNSVLLSQGIYVQEVARLHLTHAISLFKPAHSKLAKNLRLSSTILVHPQRQKHSLQSRQAH